MHKTELLDAIRTSHRQLERYIFHFEKESTDTFVASNRPKFSKEEMLQPGVVDGWSLRDLLAYLIDWERRFISWYQVSNGVDPSGVPDPDLDWAQMQTGEYDPPEDLRTSSIDALLIQFQHSFAGLLSTLEAIPETDLFTPGLYTWTGECTLADYAALVTCRHYDWAKECIRCWRKIHAGQHLSKGAILERIQTERRRLEANLKGLSRQQMEAVGVVGEWSVKDLLAHLTEWEQMFIGWYQAGLRGEMPEIPAPSIGWGDLDLLNQQIYEKHRGQDLDHVLSEFHSSHEQALKIIREMSEEDIFRVGRYPWLGNTNIAGYLLANTVHHYRWAKDQIRQWKKATSES